MTDQTGTESLKEILATRQVPPASGNPAPASTTGLCERAWPSGVGPSLWVMVAAPVRLAIHHAIENSKWPIYLTGDTGAGKSCAAACVWSGWRGSPARWYRASEIVGDVLACRSNGKGYIVRRSEDTTWEEWESGIMRKVADASLAVFDDVGIRDPSPAAYEIFYLMVESRKGKPTIYTSNLDAAALNRLYDARIASRLLCGTRIRVRGTDRRLENGVTA